MRLFCHAGEPGCGVLDLEGAPEACCGGLEHPAIRIFGVRVLNPRLLDTGERSHPGGERLADCLERYGHISFSVTAMKETPYTPLGAMRLYPSGVILTLGPLG
ncbi:hypothetical protein D3C76_1431630 [compost metagenome]